MSKRGALLVVVMAIGSGMVAFSGAARAQGAGTSATMGDYQHSNGRGSRGTPNAPSGSNAPSPSPRALPEVWPRLDVGAVFCQSQDDLVARARMPAGRLPTGCRLMQSRTGITIVNRIPPGSTQIKLSGNGEVGWTDAWLPERPPLGATGRQAPVNPAE